MKCGTCHFACDCREEYVRKLEKVATAAQGLFVWMQQSGLRYNEKFPGLRDAIAELDRAADSGEERGMR